MCRGAIVHVLQYQRVNKPASWGFAFPTSSKLTHVSFWQRHTVHVCQMGETPTSPTCAFVKRPLGKRTYVNSASRQAVLVYPDWWVLFGLAGPYGAFPAPFGAVSCGVKALSQEVVMARWAEPSRDAPGNAYNQGKYRAMSENHRRASGRHGGSDWLSLRVSPCSAGVAQKSQKEGNRWP